MPVLDVESLKSANPIREVAARLGIALNKTGHAPCPRCGGTDRFYIDAKKGFWGCRKCHEKPSDAIGLVEFVRSVGFREACEFLGAGSHTRTNGEASKVRDPEADTRYYERLCRLGAPMWQYEGQDAEILGVKVLAARNGNKKEFRWFTPVGSKWLMRGPAIKLLYRASEVRKAVIHGRAVWLHEGEKGCDRMREATGAVCTTHGYGAGGWTAAFAEQLRGARLVVVADRDAQGEAFAKSVVETCRPLCQQIKVVQSKTEGDHDDAYDHFEAGYGIADFVCRQDLCGSAYDSNLVRFGDDFEPVVPEFVWNPYLPVGKVILIDGDGGLGKSSLTLAFAAAFSNGLTPYDCEPCTPLKTLYVGHGEDDANELETVYRACEGKPGFIDYHMAGLTFDDRGFAELRSLILAHGYRLVVLDGIFDFLQGSARDSGDPIQIAAVMGRLQRFAAEMRLVVILSRHVGKDSTGKLKSNLGMGSAMIRNKARGQLIVTWHPDQSHWRGVAVVEDGRGSILRDRGKPFAFRRVGMAVEWVKNCPLEDEHPNQATVSRGRPGGMLSKAVDALESLLLRVGQARFSEAVEHTMRESGCGRSLVYKAKAALGVRDINGTWSLPEGYDPFADGGRYWAGLE